MNIKKYLIVFGVLILVFLGVSFLPSQKEDKPTKVYWFIPDGMRAEPDIFNIYKWAEEGKLPNIKKLMKNGSYGYSIPVFPSHTPVNFASLLTGAYPKTHGVSDGPMHAEGYPLEKPSVAGFASPAKRVAPIWTVLEKAGKKIVLLSIPGSTPPELKNGITIRGRWAPWGLDTAAIIFEPKEKLEEMKSAGKGFKLFYLGQKLTQFIDKLTASGWENPPKSFSEPKETTMDAYGTPVKALIYDATDDNKINYDSVLFSLDKKSELVILKQGQWSEWLPIKLIWKDAPLDSQVKIKVIKLWENGDFRIILFFNNINKFLTEPANIAAELTSAIGPMIDFPDNWPGQLMYEPEDKGTFFEEAAMSLDWHKAAVGFILKNYKPDIFIQDTYTPNQMLESRWWMKEIDKERAGYNEANAAKAWEDIFWMYKKIDDIVGEAMKNIDKNTLFIFSSDHGVIPARRQFSINNLFAQKGWLKYSINKTTGEPTIDWKNSKVVYLKMAYVYINPNGLDGNWKRGSGKKYEALRDEVIKVLSEVKDDNGVKPLVNAVKWENATAVYELPADRIGDLVLEVVPGYQLWEEVSADGKVFVDSLVGGYKQAINPKTTKGMWTPFIIAGPGVKRDFKIDQPISNIDQMPTILKLLGVEIPAYVEGRTLTEILK